VVAGQHYPTGAEQRWTPAAFTAEGLAPLSREAAGRLFDALRAELGRIGCRVEAERTPAAANAPPRVVAPVGGARVVERARKYLATIPGAVSGSGGHVQTLLAAEHMVRGFRLDRDVALSILESDYNPRCEPPWAERELRHKVEEAAEHGTAVAVGQHLVEDRPAAVERFEEERAAVAGSSGRPGLATMGDLLDAELGRIEKGVPRLATGFPRFDAAIGGGLQVPSLNVIGAGPKSLKSSWCQVAAERHAASGGAVYYLDLENGATRFLRRLLCRKAGLGMREVATALESPGSPAFQTRDAVERWRAAQAWAKDLPILLRFRPPDDLVADLEEAKRVAGDRTLLVVGDSLQKLPGDLSERRAVVDSWVRMLERLRLDLNLVILLVSEIRRGREGYAPREDAFKESSGIEYGADLAFTLSRSAADEDGDETSTLRVELARDCEEDPRGDVASYRPVRPHYGIEEIDPEPRKSKRRPGPRAEARSAAEDFLRERLAAGPVRVHDLLAAAQQAGIPESTVRRAKTALGLVQRTVGMKKAWGLP